MATKYHCDLCDKVVGDTDRIIIGLRTRGNLVANSNGEYEFCSEKCASKYIDQVLKDSLEARKGS